MKVCPNCEASYDDRVDFCFEDGSPLEVQSGATPVEMAEVPAAVGATGLDVPEAAGLNKPSKAGAKKRRGRSGMFARPSVADMLAVPEPGAIPRVGGGPASPDPVATPPDPVTEAPEPASAVPEPAIEVPEPAIEVPEPAIEAPEPAIEVPEPAIEVPEPAIEVPEPATEAPERLVVSAEEPPSAELQPDETPTEIFEASEAAFFGEGARLAEENLDSPAAIEAPTPIDVPSPAPIDVPSPAPIDVPAPALAVEAQEEAPTEDPQEEDVPEEAPPAPSIEEETEADVPDEAAAVGLSGLDAPDAAGFFGESAGETDPLIEDPGFAEVGRVPVPDPVGFEDKPFYAGGVQPAQGSSSKGWILWAGGALALVASGLVAVFMLATVEEPNIAKRPAPKPPVAQALPPPPVVEAGGDVVADEEDIAPDVGDGLALDVPPPIEDFPEEEVVEEPLEVVEEPPEVIEEPPPVGEETPRERERRLERERKRQEERDLARQQAPAPVDPPSPWTGGQDPPPVVEEVVEEGGDSPWGAQEVSRGRLTITSNPSGAVVHLDGRRIGRTPTSTEVDYGSHAVKIELADYRSASKTISVRSAQMSLPFQLQTAQMYAKCNLSGPMGAKVLMDGRPLGALPRSVRCSAGAHRFRVIQSGKDPYNAVRKIQPTEPGESINVYLGGG